MIWGGKEEKGKQGERKIFHMNEPRYGEGYSVRPYHGGKQGIGGGGG